MDNRSDNGSAQEENYKLALKRMKQKLDVTRRANEDLINETERLRARLQHQEDIKSKYKYLKMNYQQVLCQLEKFEMARRNEKDNVKALKSKVHKLKKEKRQLQDELSRNFGTS